MLRKPEIYHHAQFWAEDGAIFFAQQFNYGVWECLFRPYAGYLHAIPRLVAAATAIVPIFWVPTVFCAVSALLAAMTCACFDWPCFRFAMPSDSLRAACCLVVAMALPVSDELLATLCNLQRYLAIFGILLAVIPVNRITGKRYEVILLVSQVLFALSSPAMLILLPILAWQAVHRHGLSLLRPLATILALLLQGFLTLTSSTATGNPHLDLNSLFSASLAAGLSRVVLFPILGAQTFKGDSPQTLFIKLGVALLLAIALLVLLICWLKGADRIHALFASYVVVTSLALLICGRNFYASLSSADGIIHFQGTRYFFIPACAFVFLMALLFQEIAKRCALSPGYASVALMLFFIFGTLRNFSATPLVNLAWRDHAKQIKALADKNARHEPVSPLILPLNPPPFSTELTGHT